VPTAIEAEEAEEIGVEHLLRDIKDNAVGTLSSQLTTQLNSLKGLQSRLEEIKGYLEKVVKDEMPINHQIIYNLQDIFNLLPNLNVADIAKSFAVQTNDEMLIIYVSSLIRSIIALHNLINNRLSLRDAEAEAEGGKESKDEKKEEAKDDKESKDPKDEKTKKDEKK